MNGSFPYVRPRRLRQSPALRALVQEHRLSPEQWIVPLFVTEGEGLREPIASMPGYCRYSLDEALTWLHSLDGLGLRSLLLFVKVPDERKDNTGEAALDPHGLMPRAIRAIRQQLPHWVVMTDVALDPYSLHGHDGLVVDGRIANDETLEVLANMALMHAVAGAQVVAPSDMMDGRVMAIRGRLEQEGLNDTAILSYTAKYASCFYGPFRDALDSAPGFGDKKTYQMNPANLAEALHELQQDVAEGADIVMVKPGLPYLDVLHAVCQHSPVPVAAYQVSGEYAMIKAAAAAGYLEENTAVLESLMAFNRAGARMVATYFAEQAARLLA